MKKLSILLSIAVLLSACGLNRQARQLEALEKCIYEIRSADSVYLAGRDISKLVQDKSFSVSDVPELAIAYLRKDIPFRARVSLQVKNPTDNLAGINQFEYIILIKDQQLANGVVNQNISVAPGDSVTIPVQVNANVYSLLSKGKAMEEIFAFIQGGNTDATEKKGVITLKIKPTIALGNKRIKYPGYITVDKEVSSKILF